jgi:adenosylcobinamide-phosphate guanylyltransferase
MIKSVIMAGGLGSRLKTETEKPLFIFNKKHLIDYVIENLINSSAIEEIFVAVSPNTPNTKKYISKLENIKIIDTPGEGYLNDLSFLLDYFEKESKDDVLTFINSDLPFISYNCIDHVLREYFKFNKDSLSVYIPADFLDDLNFNYEYEYKGLVPSGLNILRSQNIVQEEHELIIPLIDFAININTLEDVDVANDIYDF